MEEPVETAELQAFVHIVDAGSLSLAAKRLGVPRATLSRRLARLEARLEVRLVHRTTRQLALSEAGGRFYRHATAVLEAVATAQAAVQADTDHISGELKVSLPPGDGRLIYAMLHEYMARYPDVRLQVTFSTAHVDLLREGFDVAIRAGELHGEGLVLRTLTRVRSIAVASRGYLDAHGTPSSVHQLVDHRLITGFDRGAVPRKVWPSTAGPVRIEPHLATNDMRFVAELVAQHRGIALLPAGFVRDGLDDGSLVPVLPGVLESEGRVAVVYPDREYLPPQVRAFADLAVAWSREMQFGPDTAPRVD